MISAEVHLPVTLNVLKFARNEEGSSVVFHVNRNMR
jgi:hypothetical protein